MVNGNEVRAFVQEILPSKSATVKARKTEIDKLDEEIERALRLLFMLARKHTLLRMFLNIWRQVLFPGDLHDAGLYNFWTTECENSKCPCGMQLPASLSNYQCTFT